MSLPWATAALLVLAGCCYVPHLLMGQLRLLGLEWAQTLLGQKATAFTRARYGLVRARAWIVALLLWGFGVSYIYLVAEHEGVRWHPTEIADEP